MPKRKKKKPTRHAPDPGRRFLEQMGRYMKTRGWTVVGAGPIGIVKGTDWRHQLVVNFIGGPQKKEEAASPERR